MSLKAVNDKVIVRKVEVESMSSGGLHLASNNKQPRNEGIVLSVGPGKILDNGQLITPQVKAGDRVVFGKYSGCVISNNKEDLLFLKEEEILAVYEE